MLRLNLLLTALLILVLSFPTQSQSWDLLAAASGGLPADSIRDLQNGGGGWLMYALHPTSISRFNGLWQNSNDTFGIGPDGHQNLRIYFDSNGDLWIGRTNGIYLVSHASLDSISPHAQDLTGIFFSDSEPPPVVTAMLRDRDQALWIGTQNRGLFRFGTQELVQSLRVTLSDGRARKALDAPIIKDIVQDEQGGFVWVGTDRGLVQLSPLGDSLNSFLHDPRIRSIYADHNGRVWIGTADADNGKGGGLYVIINPFAPLPTALPSPLRCDGEPVQQDVFDVVQDFAGSVWAVSPRNVIRYQSLDSADPRDWQAEVFPCSDEWPAIIKGITQTAVDQTGFVWVASHGEGILRYNMLWQAFDLTDPSRAGLLSNDVTALTWNPDDGNVYVGTEGGGAAKWSSTQAWQKVESPSADCSVYSFLHDIGELVLMGVNCTGFDYPARIFGVNAERALPIFCADGLCADLTDNVFEAIVKLPNDQFWLAGENHLWSAEIAGLNSIAPTVTYSSITSLLGFSEQKFFTLLLQDSSFVWIASAHEGLARFNLRQNQIDQRWHEVGNFGAIGVHALQLGDNGVLWIGTSGGLTRLRLPLDAGSPQWMDLTQSGEVNFVFTTANGEAWFDAADGVAHYSEEAGVTLFPRPQRPGESGPLSKEVRTGVSVPHTQREIFWFGTDQGISVFQGDVIPPDTRITRPTPEEREPVFIMPGAILLASGSLFVQWEGGDNLTGNQNLYYQTALTRPGEKLEWSPFSRSTSELLTFRESGVFQFSIRARDQSGNLDPTPASLSIIVDLDAPSVVITGPAPLVDGAIPWVRADLAVSGSVIDTDLAEVRIEVTNVETAEIYRIKRWVPSGTARIIPALRDTTLAKFDIAELNELLLRIVVTATDTLAHLRHDSVFVQVDAISPELGIIRPVDSSQVESQFEASLRFIERHHRSGIEYFEPGQFDTTRLALGSVRADLSTPDETDSLFFTAVDISDSPGEHTVVFAFHDLAGNVAFDTLVVSRIMSGIASASIIHHSQDGRVEVHVPPGPIPLSLRISPLDSSDYYSDAIARNILPKSRAYRVEPENKFDREATLTIIVSGEGNAPGNCAIFRWEGEELVNVGGRYSVESQRPLLRTVIDRGGVYLAATGKAEAGGSGNLTCLPRMFSPGQQSYAPFTDVIFSLSRPSNVSIRVYNTAGRQVRNLTDNETMPSGRHAVRWDGRGNGNTSLRSGVYIVAVRTDEFAETKTVVIQN